MHVKTVKVSDKGQIAIPIDMRKEAGIQKGDEIILVQDGDRILIEPAKKMQLYMKDDFSDLLQLSQQSLVDLWDNEEDEIWNTYLQK